MEHSVNLGSFRIRWNIYENSYKYIYPFYRMDTYFGFDVASDDTVCLKPSKTYDD